MVADRGRTQGNQDKVADLQNRIVKEQKIIAGFQAMRSATANQDTIRSCESKIRDGERNIRFFQESIRELQGSRPSPAGPGGAGGSAGGPMMAGGIGKGPDGGYRRGGHGQFNDAEHAGPQQGKYAGQIAPPANGPGLRKATYTNLGAFSSPLEARRFGGSRSPQTCANTTRR